MNCKAKLKSLGTKYCEYHKQPTPEKLFNICLQFIVGNICSVDSLNNFPETMGEILFKEVIKSRLFPLSDQTTWIKIIDLFSVSYGSELLSSLYLSHQLILINEFLEPLMKVSAYIYALDLSNCYLGDEHELIQYIGELKSLRQLSLKKNDLSDAAIRKLTLPARMFGQGIKSLEFLDISYNNKITQKSLSWLSKLTQLTTLILTGTGVSDTSVRNFGKNHGLDLSTDSCSNFIQTVGWALLLINEWGILCQKIYDRKIPLANSGLCNFYQNKQVKAKQILHELSKQQIDHYEHHIVILKKNSPLVESLKISSSKRDDSNVTNLKASTSKRLKRIEDDLFAQYI